MTDQAKQARRERVLVSHEELDERRRQRDKAKASAQAFANTILDITEAAS